MQPVLFSISSKVMYQLPIPSVLSAVRILFRLTSGDKVAYIAQIHCVLRVHFVLILTILHTQNLIQLHLYSQS